MQQPSAHADDRRQPGARAAGADAAQGRPDRPRRRRARAREAIRARIAALRAEGVRHRHRRRGLQRRPAALGAALAGMPLVTAGSGVAHRPAAELRQRAACSPPAQAPTALPPPRACGGASRAAARWRPTRRSRTSCAPGRPALRDRSAARSPPATTSSAQALRWAAPLLARRPGAGLRHRRAERGARRCRRSWASARAGALVEQALAAHRARPGRARRAPARRRRRRDLGRRACRRSASRSCASARRSIPACRGRRAVAGRGGAALHLALKSGNFGSADFFTQGLRGSAAR